VSGKDIAQSLASANNTIYAGTQDDGVWAYTPAPTISSSTSFSPTSSTAGSYPQTTTVNVVTANASNGTQVTANLLDASNNVQATNNGTISSNAASISLAVSELLPTGQYTVQVVVTGASNSPYTAGTYTINPFAISSSFSPTSGTVGTAQTVTVHVGSASYVPNDLPVTVNLLDQSNNVQATGNDTFQSGDAWVSLDVPASLPAGQYTVQVVVTGASNSPYTAGTYTINNSSGGTGSGSALIDPAVGGTVSLSGGQASVSIPAGALNSGQPVTVTITPVSGSTAPSGYSVAGSVYDFTVNGSGYSFNSPVTITFTVDPSSLPSGVTMSNLAVYYNNGSGWQQVPQSDISINGDTVSITVNHFTQFAVAYPTPSGNVTGAGTGGSESFPISSATPSYFEGL
jgi:hypothetical protein